MSTVAPKRVDTARLACERLRPEHATELERLLLDPQVVPTLWPWPEPPTAVDVHAGLARQIDHWERHGFGLWLLRDQVTGEMVGRGGLVYTDATGFDQVEVGWAIVPERWGQGLATELALTAVRVAFADMELVELIALALPDNHASRRVMEKAGFTYERELMYVGLPHVLYRRRSEEG